ncbi:hypothetical protein SADUNF_Sadunf01G0040600 [Salix dunnii]|uniref:Uncharacterized protein n=1 Tax=Salix dunnii TaxID=1413687 RepID=A0A835N9X1_9ROSI|nr:hypothetical protein SADUNF_Sadunf01G0040600 [Salix dunnii]
MESLDTTASFMMDDLLDFGSDIGEEEDGEEHQKNNKKPRKALPSFNPNAFLLASFNVLEHSFLPEFAEEDLEWLSNKDAFPTVETCCGSLSREPGSIPKHHSQEFVLTTLLAAQATMLIVVMASLDGPKTLCNAYGVRYKFGRLVHEYRPTNSPSFSKNFHSNSHRKVLEIRRQKQMIGFLVMKPMDKSCNTIEIGGLEKILLEFPMYRHGYCNEVFSIVVIHMADFVVLFFVVPFLFEILGQILFVISSTWMAIWCLLYLDDFNTWNEMVDMDIIFLLVMCSAYTNSHDKFNVSYTKVSQLFNLGQSCGLTTSGIDQSGTTGDETSLLDSEPKHKLQEK